MMLTREAPKRQALAFLRAAYQKREARSPELLVLADWLEEHGHPLADDVRGLAEAQFARSSEKKTFTRGRWWTVSIKPYCRDEWELRWRIWLDKSPDVSFHGIVRRCRVLTGGMPQLAETARLTLIAALFGIRFHWVTRRSALAEAAA